MMVLIETPLCRERGWTLESLRDRGWGDGALMAEGLAVVFTPDRCALPVGERLPPVAYGAEVPRHAAPVITLDAVRSLLDHYGATRFYPGGYSVEQHVLHVVNHLREPDHD